MRRPASRSSVSLQSRAWQLPGILRKSRARSPHLEVLDVGSPSLRRKAGAIRAPSSKRIVHDDLRIRHDQTFGQRLRLRKQRPGPVIQSQPTSARRSASPVGMISRTARRSMRSVVQRHPIGDAPRDRDPPPKKRETLAPPSCEPCRGPSRSSNMARDPASTRACRSIHNLVDRRKRPQIRPPRRVPRGATSDGSEESRARAATACRSPCDE
jgi:hypothetical protein